jgi:hypothetical protein
MKTSPFVLAAMLAATAFVRSQDEPIADSREPAAAPAITPTTARIIGKIPDGTPPPPAPPKPEFVVSAKNILATTTHEQGGRTITIRQIKPIDLPPPPAADEAAMFEPDSEFLRRLAEYRVAHPRARTLFLSASVYRSKDSPPRTLVRYWPEGQGGGVTFWSSADFALIAGGIQTFADSTGKTHHIFMGWGNVDIDRMTALRAAKGLQYNVPETPSFPVGKATYQFVGQQPTPENLVAIKSLHDLYNNEHTRLLTAFEGREQARIEREAWLKAHPPQPKNITLNYWRTEKPTPKKRGGTQ